ncbi:MAG: fibronectin type III domain-containing protein, partial [Actinomycetota bacterium]
GVAVNPTTGTVYVANIYSNSVSVIIGSNNTVTIYPPSSQAAQNLTWTWSDPDPSVTSYSWTGACSGSGFVTSVTCTGLTGGQSYSLSVTATNGIGISDSATSTGVAEDVPGTVTFSSPSVVGRGQASFSWSDSVTNGAPITSYSWTGACSGSGLVTSVTCTGLTGGQSYSLSVTATNAMGTGPSAASTLKMPITSPDSVAPRITVAGTSFTASWAAPHNGGAALTGYTVTVLGANNKLISSTTLKSTVLTFTQSKLTTGATYTLSIAAANTSLLTSSPFVSSVTPKNPETLTVPAKLSYSYGASSTKVSVSLSTKATGTVSFTTGSTTLCVAIVSSTSANCSVNSTLLNAGSYPLSASYSGDSLTSIAISAGTFKVTPASSTLKVSTNVNGVTSARLGTLLVTATLGSAIGTVPSGTVSLSLDGTVIAANAVTFSFATWTPSKPLTKGTHTLTANYGGSTNFSAVSAFCKFVVQ